MCEATCRVTYPAIKVCPPATHRAVFSGLVVACTAQQREAHGKRALQASSASGPAPGRASAAMRHHVGHHVFNLRLGQVSFLLRDLGRSIVHGLRLVHSRQRHGQPSATPTLASGGRRGELRPPALLRHARSHWPVSSFIRTHGAIRDFATNRCRAHSERRVGPSDDSGLDRQPRAPHGWRAHLIKIDWQRHAARRTHDTRARRHQCIRPCPPACVRRYVVSKRNVESKSLPKFWPAMAACPTTRTQKKTPRGK